MLVFHVVVGLGGHISKNSQSLLIFGKRLSIPLLFEQQITLLLYLLTHMNLNKVMLVSQFLVLFGVVKTCFEVLRQRLKVLPLIFELALFELCCFLEYLLKFLHVLNNLIDIVQMGKKKQQKAYRLNRPKDTAQQQKMSQIMKQLSKMRKANKQENAQPQQKANIDIGLFKKKIKKDEKMKKYLQRNGKGENQEEEEVEVMGPKVNIFSVDNYNSGVKTVVNTREPKEEMQDETKLFNQTQKMMGGELNVQTFGDKPLRIIQEQEVVQLSDDEDQPNSTKNITHKDLDIPSGNHKIQRSKQIEEFREKLPIYMKEQEIIETVNNHLVTLICGETGSGKSTQLGQFLVEKNYQQFGKIAITQPRRLATIALAARVADETGSRLGQMVGYQVRHDKKDSPSSLIKYLTDGILLNEMSSDYLLTAYSVIVIDEAHERKVNTDILIGLLSKLVVTRYLMSVEGKCNPLRLVIMSATMRVQDFKNQKLFDYFVPIINVEARMFPVSTYFQKNTPQDYKSAAVKKCLRIHRKLPDGDVLVFMTGKDEIHEVANMLEQALGEDHFQESENEDQMMQEVEVQHQQPKSHLIHCLYSSLPMTQQQLIFKPTPQNCRKFIISTNIAQTSITIPNIRYVVDSGQEKHRYHEGVQKWRKGWGSRAMAEQRAGRAGRTTHGYCYRLYSSALYANIMEEYPLPEISKLPLEGVLLQLKAIGIPNVFAFPFPTAPPIQKIATSLLGLREIKALQGQIGVQSQGTKITELGSVLSFLPLDPKLGKILLMGRKANIPKHSLLLVILLTVESIFLDAFKVQSKMQLQDLNSSKSRQLQQMRAKSNSFKSTYKQFIMEGHHGDIFTCLNILGHFFVELYRQTGNVMNKIRRLSNQLHLNQNVLRQIYYNTDQIAEIYETLSSQKIDMSTYIKPTASEISGLMDILLTTFVNNLCRLQEKNKYKNKNNQIVFVHRLSDTYFRNNLFMACTQFYGNQLGRNYMRYPFPVKNYQLLATFGTINPATDFLWRDGQVAGLSTGVIFGWEIPNLFVGEVNQDIKYVYTAKFLLQGKIFQPLKVLQKYHRAPTSIFKPGSIDYKVQKLVEALKVRKIGDWAQLLRWWGRDKNFLKQELRVWVEMKNFDEVYEKIRSTIILNSSK